MLRNCLAAIAATCAIMAIATPEPVLADGMPAASTRKVVKSVKTHRVYGYHYVRGTWPGGPDPYAYSYKRAGYYPYYDSRYWVPRKQMAGRFRYPMRIPEYYSSWGYPLTCKRLGKRHCGVPFIKPAGDPRHYYRRDVQRPPLPHALRKHRHHHG